MSYTIQLTSLIVFLFGLLNNAIAFQWQTLNVTSRHKVSYDKQSIRPTSTGQFEILLWFIPKGEMERKSAATEYKEKRYRSHTELYEIFCDEQTALLKMTEIVGASQIRLKKLKGGILPEPLLPGSLLESAANLVCPVPDSENAGEVDTEQPEPPGNPDTDKVASLSGSQLEQFNKLIDKINANEADVETWKELGNIYFDTDQPEQAIHAYGNALALQPDNTDILNDQGAMFRQTGDFVHALANFEKACSIDPNNLESLYNSAYVYAFDLNNIPKALTLWRRHLELDSKSDAAKQVQLYIKQFEK